jgi:hypothetical protein
VNAVGATTGSPAPDVLSHDEVVPAAPYRESFDVHEFQAQAATATLPRLVRFRLGAGQSEGLLRSLLSTSQITHANVAVAVIGAGTSTLRPIAVALGAQDQPAVLRAASSHWYREAVRDLQQSVSLPRNWDTYGGSPASVESARDALAFLVETLAVGTAAPAVAPVGEGGVQLDWRQGGLEIEVVFAAGEEAGLYLHDLETGEEWEGPLEEGRLALRRVVPRLEATSEG